MTQDTRDPVPVASKRVEFLDKRSYRQRRIRDAARMLPVFAAIMMALPLMWPRGQADQSLTSTGIIYVFGLWAVLLVLAFAVSLVLRSDDDRDTPSDVRRRDE